MKPHSSGMGENHACFNENNQTDYWPLGKETGVAKGAPKKKVPKVVKIALLRVIPAMTFQNAHGASGLRDRT